MSADGDLREYAPTARRLARLRQAGIFPHSQVLTAAGVLAAVLLIAAGFLGLIVGVLSRLLAGLLKSSFDDPVAALSTPPLIEAGLVLVAALVAAKLVIVPGLALLVIPLLGLSAQIAIVMMVAAMQPPALNLAVQAKEFAAPKAQELINEGLFFSYLASVITLTAFLSILKMIL